MIKVIQKEFIITLDQLSKYYQKTDKSLWPEKLKRINQFVFQQCQLEKELILKNPEIVINKLRKVPGIYWLTLGKIKYKTLTYFLTRLRVGITWRLNKSNTAKIVALCILSHYQVLLGEILNNICKKISKIKMKNGIFICILWTYMILGLLVILSFTSRYRYFFRWFVERISGRTKQRFTYVTSLMYIDQCLEKLLQHLKREKYY